MRKLLVLILLFLFIPGIAGTYYVSPSGNDSNAGTITAPWLSWHYAFNKLLPGDVLFVRGGIYTAMFSSNYGVRLSRSGTAAAHITVSSYQNEIPILDCINLVSSGGGHTGIDVTVNYWDFTGLTVRNVSEAASHPSPYPANGWFIYGDYLTFTCCNSYDNGGGFAAVGDYVYFTNCDAYQNNDEYDNGGYANGWSSNIDPGHHMFWEGCRAWLNSDDGWDLFGGGHITVFNNCWAFENGYWNGYTGNGAGFKTGRAYIATSGLVRTITNCLAFNNRLVGFDESQDGVYASSITHNIFNNTSYNNGYSFNFGYAGVYTDIIRNNISYSEQIGSLGSNSVDHNSWNGFIVTDADFQSLDASEAKAARKADGSLPDMTFLHLKSTSGLINKGVNVGLPYSGSAPDLGAFEYSGVKTILMFNNSILIY
jgi:hypothetical protein